MSREEFLTQRLSERSHALSRLQGGIQDYLDGDYGRDKHFKTKHDTCPHGQFSWVSCEPCIDKYFTQLLAESRSPEASKETP